MIWATSGGQSGFTGEETNSWAVAFIVWLAALLWKIRVVTCDWQPSGTCGLMALSPILAFSGAFVAENESFLAGNFEPKE